MISRTLSRTPVKDPRRSRNKPSVRNDGRVVDFPHELVKRSRLSGFVGLSCPEPNPGAGARLHDLSCLDRGDLAGSDARHLDEQKRDASFRRLTVALSES